MTQRVFFGRLCSLIACCLFYLAQGLRNDEYCTKLSSNAEATVVINADRNIDQDECVKYFQVHIPDASSGFLSFEVNINNMPSKDITLALLKKEGAKPEINENGRLDDGVDIDYSGYSNIRPYHTIIVNLASLTGPTDLFFAVYEYAPDKTKSNYRVENINYDIKTRRTSDYPCRRDCINENQGICSQDYKQCVCKQGFFDVDCSVSGMELPFDGTASQIINPETWTYFYLNAKDYGGNLKLYAESEDVLSLSFLFNNPLEFYLSNSILSDGQFQLKTGALEQTLRLPQSGFKLHNGGRLMIGAYNEGTGPVTLKLAVSIFDQEGSSRSSIMFIMIGIACGLIILWIAFSIIKYRAYRHAALARRHENMMLQRSILSREEIDKYFATKDFSTCSSSFPQTLCSICLDDFQHDTPCRQLYCEHIFHGLCIESWFANHTNCPNCKKPMTREGIEEFIKNPVKPVTSPKDIEANPSNTQANASPETKDMSKDMLNSASIDEGRGKQRVQDGIDLDSPLARTAKNKTGKRDIKINAAETAITSSIKSRDVTRSEIKDNIEEEMVASRMENHAEGIEGDLAVSQHIENDKTDI